MNVFLRLKKILFSALCISQIAICANTSQNIYDKDPVDRLKNQVDECEWLGSESKGLLGIMPPFRQFCAKAMTCVKSLIRPQSEINLKQAKTDAIEFFSKYLVKMPDFLNIAKDVINNGHYTYVDLEHWMHIIDSQTQSVISEDDGWSNNVDEIVQLLMRGKTKDDIVKRCMPFLSVDNFLDKEAARSAMEFLDEVERKYMNLSDVSKNFEISVFYTNQKTLLVTTIQETGHVLDYAYRIKLGKCSKVPTTDLNAVSVFFETIAKRDFESNGYDVLRLIAPYEALMEFDWIQRVNNRRNGTISDNVTLEQIHQEIERDWQSPVTELMQLGMGNGEILKFIQWIRSGGVLEFALYDQLRQMSRAKILLDSEKDLINKMPEIIEHLIMESALPLTGNEYLQLYDSIMV